MGILFIRPMKKYTKKEYRKYRRAVIKSFGRDVSISFEYWKKIQPIADQAVGKINKMIAEI